MHQAEMKKQGFIKNKVMGRLVVASVNKVSQIPHINVISPTFEEDHGVTYKIHALLIKYASCTCTSELLTPARSTGNCSLPTGRGTKSAPKSMVTQVGHSDCCKRLGELEPIT
jgi:hypothetical protein